MKTKIDYYKEMQRLKKSAEKELKEALRKFPNNEYEFVTEEQAENICDIDDPLRVSVWDSFGGCPFEIYVVKVCLYNDNLEVWGFSVDGGSYDYIGNFKSCDITYGGLGLILQYLPEVENSTSNIDKDRVLKETICLLAADIYQDVYEKEEGFTGACNSIITLAEEFEMRLNWQKDDERDFIEELEKFEKEVLERYL